MELDQTGTEHLIDETIWRRYRQTGAQSAPTLTLPNIPSAAETADWHRTCATEAKYEGNTYAVHWHLDRLRTLRRN